MSNLHNLITPPEQRIRTALLLALVTLLLLLLLGCSPRPYVPVPTRVEYRTVTVLQPITPPCVSLPSEPDFQLPAAMAAATGPSDWPRLMKAIQHDLDELLAWRQAARLAIERVNLACAPKDTP